MIRQAATFLDNNMVTVTNRPTGNWMHVCATVPAAIAIVSPAFHFWPFENSKAWQMFNLANLAVLVWSLLLACLFLLKPNRRKITSLLPHLSVFAYLSINILSMAFTPDLSRAAIFTIKLALILVGGYTLFSSAISNARSLRRVYALTTAAVIMTVSYCLITRFVLGPDKFGFYSNPYKYGTFIGMLVPLCSTYLFTSFKNRNILLGAALVIGAFVSSGSLGAVAAITVGIATAIIIIPIRSIRFCITASLLCGIGILFLLNSSPVASALQDDIKLAEKDGVNLKQRYIEWQAEVNLVEDRTITGTAAGCINEYRSNYYYRLPKLNTLKPFDQNGWLATGAETGVLGLVCFCWIVAHYGKLALVQVTQHGRKISATTNRFAQANLVGLATACVANLFSSVHYNGILITFVLLLALISRTNYLFTEH